MKSKDIIPGGEYAVNNNRGGNRHGSATRVRVIEQGEMTTGRPWGAPTIRGWWSVPLDRETGDDIAPYKYERNTTDERLAIGQKLCRAADILTTWAEHLEVRKSHEQRKVEVAERVAARRVQADDIATRLEAIGIPATVNWYGSEAISIRWSDAEVVVTMLEAGHAAGA